MQYHKKIEAMYSHIQNEVTSEVNDKRIFFRIMYIMLKSLERERELFFLNG